MAPKEHTPPKDWNIHPSSLPIFHKTFFVTGLIAMAAAMIFLAVPKEKRPE